MNDEFNSLRIPWEEAVQEALMRAYKNLKGRSLGEVQEMALKPFLFKIVQNTCYSKLKERGNSNVSIEKDEDLLEVEGDNPQMQPESAFELAEVSRVVRDVVEELLRPRRDVIKLRYFDEYSEAEIAKILRMPEGTVKSHISRGNKFLRKKLQEFRNTRH